MQSSSRVSGFFVIALIIFFASLAVATGVFLYEKTLDKIIASNEKELIKKEKEYEANTLDEIKVKSDQINAAKDILNKHTAVSDFIKSINSFTLQSVRFKSFDYKYISPEKITVSMKGEGRNFRSIALQSDIFARQNKVFKDPIVSNLALNLDGTVDFDFTTSLYPQVVAYKIAQSSSGSATTTASSTPNITN